MNHIFSKNSFYNRGQSLVGIIVVLVIVALIGGGMYYYFSIRTSGAPSPPEPPQATEGPVVGPEPESEPEPEPEPELGTDEQSTARTHLEEVAEILKAHEEEYGEFIIFPENDEPKAGDLIPDPLDGVGFAYNITPSWAHLFATEETQPYFEHQIPKEGAVGWCWFSSDDTITFETWDECLLRRK